MGARHVILHYHLFKNAGTSVDAMLEANFGDRWHKAEFEAEGDRSNTAAVARYIAAHRDLIALSSHTALLPVPEIEGVRIFPLIFVRHPVVRIHSAYRFEAQQDADTEGARLAKRTDFAGYVSEQLAAGRPNQVRNFQAMRLAYGDPGGEGRLAERALRTVGALPFTGLVERYEASIGRLARLVAPLVPDFEPLVARKNPGGTQDATIHQRIAAIRGELGPPLFDELIRANAEDMRVYTAVMRGYFEAGPAA